MELNDFKKAWKQVTSDKVREKELDSSKINEMLHRRGTGILSRLDRSVKIGIGFLVLFFILTLADQLLPADLIFPTGGEPHWRFPNGSVCSSGL